MAVVKIYCDAADKHSKKRPRVFVDAFVGEGAEWNQRNTSPRVRRRREEKIYGATVDAGTTLVGDRLPNPGEILRHLEAGEPLQTRSRYRLECESCGPSSAIPLRQETLVWILETLANARVETITLQQVAARVSGMA